MDKNEIKSIIKLSSLTILIILGGIYLFNYLGIINSKDTVMFILAIVLVIIGLMSMMSGETNAISIRLIGQFKKDEVKAKNEMNITANVLSLSLVASGIGLYIISKIF